VECNRYNSLGACVALLMTIVICAYAQGATADEPRVPQARIDPKVVHLQVTEGTDIRFTRLSRAQGISQTRVEAIVQDDRGSCGSAPNMVRIATTAMNSGPFATSRAMRTVCAVSTSGLYSRIGRVGCG